MVINTTKKVRKLIQCMYQLKLTRMDIQIRNKTFVLLTQRAV